MLWQLAVSLDVDLKYVENSIPIINTCKMRMKWGKNLKKYIARLDMSTIRKYPRIEIYWKKGLLKRPDISFGVKLYVVLKEAVKNILKSVR